DPAPTPNRWLFTFSALRNVHHHLFGVRRAGCHQWALAASSSAISCHQAPAAGPPLQVPSLSPGSFTHSRASRCVPSETTVGRSPRARPLGLHHSSFEPLPLREVSTT